MAPDRLETGTRKLSLNRNQADQSFAQKRFEGCRWHVDENGLEYCSNRDVMPYAGKKGFAPEPWRACWAWGPATGFANPPATGFALAASSCTLNGLTVSNAASTPEHRAEPNITIRTSTLRKSKSEFIS